MGRHRELTEAGLRDTGLEQWQLLPLIEEDILDDILQE
jgi:hypothetical protein